MSNKLIQRALAVHQPFAELIVIGEKPEEYRSKPTELRERVYVYACKKLTQEDIDYCAELKLKNLPLGVLVGTVEIVGCEDDSEGFAWLLRNPEKFSKPLVPKKLPYGGAIFFPF